MIILKSSPALISLLSASKYQVMFSRLPNGQSQAQHMIASSKEGSINDELDRLIISLLNGACFHRTYEFLEHHKLAGDFCSESLDFILHFR